MPIFRQGPIRSKEIEPEPRAKPLIDANKRVGVEIFVDSPEVFGHTHTPKMDIVEFGIRYRQAQSESCFAWLPKQAYY